MSIQLIKELFEASACDAQKNIETGTVTYKLRELANYIPVYEDVLRIAGRAHREDAKLKARNNLAKNTAYLIAKLFDIAHLTQAYSQSEEFTKKLQHEIDKSTKKCISIGKKEIEVGKYIYSKGTEYLVKVTEGTNVYFIDRNFDVYYNNTYVIDGFTACVVPVRFTRIVNELNIILKAVKNNKYSLQSNNTRFVITGV